MKSQSPNDPTPLGNSNEVVQNGVVATPSDATQQIEREIEAAGGELQPDEFMFGSIGATMFDLPSSDDNTVTVLLPKENIHSAPSQALVRIKSRDKRNYLGVVTAGPFVEPDSLRADSPMLVTVTTRGGIYLPPYHGRVQVTILGEEQADGTLIPPRLRPLPNSGVFVLDEEETAKVLNCDGDIRIGLVIGYENLVVRVPSMQKSVLPRHTAILGTTGGGKSTTVAQLVQQAQAAKMAVILLDVEGEYTCLHEKTDDPTMLASLEARGLEPAGIPNTLYHLVGRETTNPEHPERKAFSLQFERLSPYTVIEILGLTEAQADRFHKAYEIAKALLRDLGIFPRPGNSDEERLAIELDEFERGYPRLTLDFLMDIVGGVVARSDDRDPSPLTSELQGQGLEALKRQISQVKIDSPVSWRALLGKLARLRRLKVFDSSGVAPLDYHTMLQPGAVSVIDLSDSGMSELSNIVIADLLRGVQETQDCLCSEYERSRAMNPAALPPARVLVIIEEAHEFLSAERIEKMPVLFEQVARIAKRGRKRWLGLVFVTQFPQHLPRQVFGLVNSYVVHKLSDPNVVSLLQRIISGIDDGLWRRLPGLAPGQAVVSFPHLTRPLLVSIDPAPAKLRLID
ncbi:ATP-binding protein [Thermomicrobiaceae bacterium CFH 74404]|uniref:ATP-binding protein n=1 Tax=Thermalbibacter longus TaxID=2951981 RepID=A0AA41W9R2_9BACT|nr:ATP-binding protein [Thermalbibacter longus]MCM8748474.1 ATP-binding protein [Thermalbibacter longus]